MKLIIKANQNTASVNICNILRQKYPKINLFEIKENVLDLDKYEEEFKKLNPELIIVASSHKSESEKPLLTAHPTGNWTSNDLGGKKEKLSYAPALYLREAISYLQQQKQELNLEDYEVGMEVTHHSPTIDFPVIFVEVGSTTENWRDKEACLAVANTIYHLYTSGPKKVQTAIGIGGGHYAPTFNRKLENIAFGHMIPKYKIENVTEKLVLEAFEKTLPKPNFAFIDWKGCGLSEQRQRIINILDKNNIKWKRDKEI